MKTLLLTLIAFLAPTISLACKESGLGGNFPNGLDEFKYIVVATVKESFHSDEYRYKPLVSFKATVVESIKGDLTEGAQIQGKPKKEEAHGICPVRLLEKVTYLFLLNKENGEYVVTRRWRPVDSEAQYFTKYISQIKDVIKSE